MIEAPEPPSETARLETLRAFKILDTDPEESFDRLARLAAQIFDVPVAHVSLIDEHREWFKASCGVDAKEGDRRTAFCAHTILSDGLLVVEDTKCDERFRDNPKVVDAPKVRFYAGAPLLTRSGLAVGALCVKDTKPRSLPDHKAQILKLLAEIVVEEMEHRLVEAALLNSENDLRESEARAQEQLAELDHVYSTAPVGLGLLDTEFRFLRINDRLAALDGVSPEDHIGRRLREFVPELADRIEAIMGKVLESRKPVFDVQLRGVAHGQNDRPMVGSLSFHPFEVPGGKLLGVSAVVQDITELKRTEEALRDSEERLSRILESAMDAIVTFDRDRSVTLFNAAAEEVFRSSSAAAIGKSFDQFASEEFRKLLDRCQQTFGESRGRKRYMWVPEGVSAVRADGEEFLVEATISRFELDDREFFTLILRDVNDRLRAEKELRQLQIENLYLHEEYESALGFEEIVGHSAEIKEVLHSVEQVAGTDSTVLLTGETGTGKELIARAIHQHSKRSERMLVTVNCAALPAGLIESELFGHEKGAYTGALSRKLGRFELANRGTIFLDEVGDLPLELQAKLLRVLQEGQFERVGGTATQTVDVRVVAATNQDLQKAIKEKSFRSDLYYRLDVFPIRLPPLRERKGDVTLLVRHFTMKHSKKMGKRIERIPQDGLRALEVYEWPGNVRELQNVVERAVILTRGSSLQLGGPLGSTAPSAPEQVFNLQELERTHILSVLRRTGWRVSGKQGAAELLGLKRTTLEARMKKLGIQREP